MSFPDFGSLAVFLILVLMGLFAAFSISASFASPKGVREAWKHFVEKWTLTGVKKQQKIEE